MENSNVENYAKKIFVAKIIQGGGVAAPVAGKIFAEVLPYLNIEKENEEQKKQIKVPDLTGRTVKEAEKILKESKLEIQIEESENNKERTIIRQIPEKEILVNEGTSIIVHTN